MHEINLIDKSFNPEAAKNYSLSVQINNNGLTYCIYDLAAGWFGMFRKHRFEQVILQDDLIRSIESVFEKDDTLSLSFQEVRVMVNTMQSTLVPDEYFDQAHAEKYLAFNQGTDIDHAVFINKITSAGLYNVFALNHDLVSAISLHFGKPVFLNQTTPFISHITKQSGSLNHQVVYIGLNPDFFDIACTGEGKLLLYNTFQYTGENDLLYYILFVYHNLGFDVQKIPLYVSGELSSKLSYWDIIRQYITDTRYDELSVSSLLSPSLKTLAASKFLNLLNVQSCALSEENSAVAK